MTLKSLVPTLFLLAMSAGLLCFALINSPIDVIVAVTHFIKEVFSASAKKLKDFA